LQILCFAIAAVLTFCAEGQTPGNEPERITASEYEVFSKYIAHSFGGMTGYERTALAISQLVIVNLTQSDERDFEKDMPWRKM